MSYRIQVRPEAGALLRTLAPHVVLRLGRALAELPDFTTCASTTASCSSWSTMRAGSWK